MLCFDYWRRSHAVSHVACVHTMAAFRFCSIFAFFGVNNHLAFPLLHFPYTYLIHSRAALTSCLNPFPYIPVHQLLRDAVFYPGEDLVWSLLSCSSLGWVSLWPHQHQRSLWRYPGNPLASLYEIYFLQPVSFSFRIFSLMLVEPVPQCVGKPSSFGGTYEHRMMSWKAV